MFCLTRLAFFFSVTPLSTSAAVYTTSNGCDRDSRRCSDPYSNGYNWCYLQDQTASVRPDQDPTGAYLSDVFRRVLLSRLLPHVSFVSMWNWHVHVVQQIPDVVHRTILAHDADQGADSRPYSSAHCRTLCSHRGPSGNFLYVSSQRRTHRQQLRPGELCKPGGGVLFECDGFDRNRNILTIESTTLKLPQAVVQNRGYLLKRCALLIGISSIDLTIGVIKVSSTDVKITLKGCFMQFGVSSGSITTLVVCAPGAGSGVSSVSAHVDGLVVVSRRR